MTTRARLTLAASAAVLALALSGCGTGAPAAPPTADADTGLAELITPGVLTVGLVLPDPPYYIADADNVPVSGITKDLLDAVAEELGVEVEYLPVAWEGGITGVAAGRYDIFGGSLYDTTERQAAGTFVDFLQEQATLITTSDRAGEFSTQADACGHSVATIRGTTDVTYATALSEQCADDGTAPLTITEYPTQQDAELALESGRTDLGIQSVPAAEYAITQGSNRALVGEPFDGGFYVGSMMNTQKKALIDAVLAAMTTLYDDGTTAELFAEYGIEPVAPGINLQK
ncbi:transporter substrate-binding domain-containing protein [Streptomyces sp. AC495_CC817]|uniref:transporter substrate-binding domain-containing protein n=1 Tax=Streptomyces sp. AC495_CC817 TaxID=2823900 RepID=UPI001C26C69B|nr:transporter substrate-binding domain-containing protein [Streptomyces sp. AC495_CC817]